MLSKICRPALTALIFAVLVLICAPFPAFAAESSLYDFEASFADKPLYYSLDEDTKTITIYNYDSIIEDLTLSATLADDSYHTVFQYSDEDGNPVVLNPDNSPECTVDEFTLMGLMEGFYKSIELKIYSGPTLVEEYQLLFRSSRLLVTSNKKVDITIENIDNIYPKLENSVWEALPENTPAEYGYYGMGSVKITLSSLHDIKSYTYTIDDSVNFTHKLDEETGNLVMTIDELAFAEEQLEISLETDEPEKEYEIKLVSGGIVKEGGLLYLSITHNFTDEDHAYFTWYKDDVKINLGSAEGAPVTYDSYSVRGVTFAAAGDYKVTAETASGITESNICTIEVIKKDTGTVNQGGGGGGGGGTKTASVKTETTAVAGPVFAQLTQESARTAIEKYKTEESLNLRVINSSVVEQDVINLLKSSAKAVSSKLYADSLKNGSVDVRLYFNIAALDAPINVAATSWDADAAHVKSLFEKWFGAKSQVLHFYQNGSFGQTVEVATLLDFKDFNTENLCFYSYNSTTNIYSQIAAPAYYFDGAGYLHFYTTAGNYIVITEKPIGS